MAIKITQFPKFKFSKPTIILGLPGTGLVGSIAASYLVDSLGLEFCGYITSPDFAPLASIHDFKPYPPARMHYSKKYNLLVILSEMSIPIASSQDLSDQVYSYAKSLGAEHIISLGGISLKEKPSTLYVISSRSEIAQEFLKNKAFNPIKEGATTGVSGLLLTQGVIDNYPVTLILAESSEDYLDPGAASLVLVELSKYLKIPVDTQKLDKEAKDVAKQMREAVIKSKLPYKRSKELGSMYG
ncbi:MAG: PAC2 family protein [Candidatus Micrarchaeia archaeon]